MIAQVASTRAALLMAGDSSNYGVPIYGASWVPTTALRSHDDDDDDEKDDKSYIVLAGGGGEGSSGIPNAVLVTLFHFHSNLLSHQPVAKEGTGGDLPYRMAVHPGGEGLICSMPKSCRWFDWDFQRADNLLGLRSSETVLEPLQDIGQQLALTFNNEGSLLAVGGEDGKLRVYKWPSLDIILDQTNVHASVKDLDFSLDGKFLVSVGSGPCRIWEVSNSTPVASLMKENDEIFGYSRFSPINDEQILYVTTMQDQGGSVSKWSTTTWKRISSKHIVRDSISAFNVSPNGKLLAIGTIEGDVLIVSSNNLEVQNAVKKAHLGLVTSLKFSEDSRSLLSTSLDSSVRVTLIKADKKGGPSLWRVILVLLIAIAVFYATSSGILPWEFNIATLRR